MPKVRIASLLSAILMAASDIQASTFTTISLAGVANEQLGSLNPAYPTGNVVLGGVPFSIPTSGNNIYSGDAAASGATGTVFAEIPINRKGIVRVATLINTKWGFPGPETKAVMTYNFSDGTTIGSRLVGNREIRDHFSGAYTNSTSSSATVNVFATTAPGHLGPGEYRMDMLNSTFSNSFEDKTLESIRFSDSGEYGVQRLYVFGLTVETIPEPNGGALLVVGVLLSAVKLRRSREASAM